MSIQRRKFWGWGYEDASPEDAHQRKIAQLLAERFGGEPPDISPPPRIDEVELPQPRVRPPAKLERICSAGAYDRASHTYGKAYRDVVRAYARDFSRAPDLVAYPESEQDVVALLDWELATLGDPLSDLAYNCMQYRIETPDGVRLADAAGRAGIPDEDAYVEASCRHSGRSGIPQWSFYLAFSLFRYASIVQGVYYRGLQGNASSSYATRMGRLVEIAAKEGWRVAQSG